LDVCSSFFYSVPHLHQFSLSEGFLPIVAVFLTIPWAQGLYRQSTSMAERNLSAVSASGQRRKSVRDEPVTSILKGGDVPYDPDHEYDADEEVLAALGYKPEFKREFSLL
jgi:hypothetical protein